MLTTATTANTSFGLIYDRTGKTEPLLRSEPAWPIATTADQGSTTTEKHKDKVTLSADGIRISQRGEAPDNRDSALTGGTDTDDQGKTGEQRSSAQQFSEADLKMIRQLKTRDQEVKTHEMAHLAAAGQYARGGPSYSYQQGPDGRRYAVGGEVPIDLGKEQTPEQTIQKMQVVKRAALAPAEPSAADRSIAATATTLESQARREQSSEQTGSAQQTRSDNPSEMTDQDARPASGQEDTGARRRLADNIFA